MTAKTSTHRANTARPTRAPQANSSRRATANSDTSEHDSTQLGRSQVGEPAQIPSNHKAQSLAPVQRKTLEYLRTFVSEHGFAPTLKDIAQHIGVRSPSTAHFHLARLETKGFIRRLDDSSYELKETLDYEPVMSALAVPLAGVIAAGRPIEAIEDTSVMVDLPPQFLQGTGEIFCLQVAGDSMIGAHIVDGDVIIVRRQDTAVDGEIVVALLEDNTATLKTFRRMKGGKIMLLPHNPNHEPITADNVTIQGRVVGLVREM